MIANGTGIAPFLGMISENRKKIPVELYCGFRNRSSFTLYETFLEEQRAAGKLSHLQLVLSREEEKEYVSHRILKNSDPVRKTLLEGGVLMICGSLTMQNDVLEVLADICSVENGMSLPECLEKGMILTDCY